MCTKCRHIFDLSLSIVQYFFIDLTKIIIQHKYIFIHQKTIKLTVHSIFFAFYWTFKTAKVIKRVDFNQIWLVCRETLCERRMWCRNQFETIPETH